MSLDARSLALFAAMMACFAMVIGLRGIRATWIVCYQLVVFVTGCALLGVAIWDVFA